MKLLVLTAILTLELSSINSFAESQTSPSRPSVCDRNRSIAQNLAENIMKDCSQITDEDLANIKSFEVNILFDKVQSSDFSGLTSIVDLGIYFDVTETLPENLFGELVSLENLEIQLAQNLDLAFLPQNIFLNHSKLKTLSIFHYRYEKPEVVLKLKNRLEQQLPNTKILIYYRDTAGGES